MNALGKNINHLRPAMCLHDFKYLARMNHRGPGRQHNQRGIVLASCLVFILIMTTIALATGSALILETKMERNFTESARAFSAAEAAIALAITTVNFSPGINIQTSDVDVDTGDNLTASYQVRYLGFSPATTPPPTLQHPCPTGTQPQMGWHHFHIVATAHSQDTSNVAGAARATVHQGLAWCAARNADENTALAGTSRRTYWRQHD